MEPFMFSEFAKEIRNLSPTGPTERELQTFLLDDSGKIRVYYAPFDWINAGARLIVVGITPGKDSMLEAFRAATSPEPLKTVHVIDSQFDSHRDRIRTISLEHTDETQTYVKQNNNQR